VAGLRSGDEIVRFGDEEVGSWDDFRALIAGADPGRVELQIVRDGEERSLPIDLSVRAKLIGTIGQDLDIIDSGDRILVGDAPEGGAAAEAGVVAGSTLVEVNGEPLRSLDDLDRAAESSTGGRVSLTTVGAGGERSVHRVDLGSDVGSTEPRAFVGVGSSPVLVRESLPDAAVGSVETFWEVTQVSIKGIGRFLWPPNMVGFVVDAFSGTPGDATDTPTLAEETPSTVSETRPISIVGVAMLGSDISSQGLSQLVPFLATLNIFIGVFNLFPLLPFDGGHVVVAIYEKLQEMRRRSRERYLADVSRMIPVAYAVVIVLGVIGLLAIFVDLTRGVSL
jgi:membrane-associated protease RseP (regulator of RpoE activity)